MPRVKGFRFPRDIITYDLVARIPALLLGYGFPNLLDIVDAV